MDRQAIENLIIELLAEEEGITPDALRDRLAAEGEDLPIDSLLAVEVVVRVEQRCGVQLPTTPETAECLRSVRDFAAIVHHLVQEAEQGRRVGEGA
ncbi:hypothetical protein GCM10027176_20080 [Actinoallomurus bryophytorum]|uniref:Acyl carrier protein n=1 Tax=Actinoallomurus bryophytorum TaxID=1490222 RepID=A0A543CKS8_9ACTN|nr:phosphopantetheine-binding protein [Actinoallomurus bryophytorum]TQL97714.1 acyl carrier protein [Actinoallomurus bryophytorum]